MHYSLTEKLKFNEKPVIYVKDNALTVNNSAITVLKLMDIVQQEGELAGAKNVMALLFSEDDQKKIEALSLSMEDYVTLASVAIDLALGNDPDAKARE